jgi:hypothetical protein
VVAAMCPFGRVGDDGPGLAPLHFVNERKEPYVLGVEAWRSNSSRSAFSFRPP